MNGVPEWALVLWTQPGEVLSRVWWYHGNMLQTIAKHHEPDPGSIITYGGNIAAGVNVTPGPYRSPYRLINDAIWQWLTKEEEGPFKREEGYEYLKKLYEGQTLQELMTLFEESNTGSDTDGYASDGEGKKSVELLNKLNIKF
jgi:hypothetical protein